MTCLSKKDYIVRSIDLITARCLIEKFHYTQGSPKLRVFAHGLFLKEKSFFDYDCLGVAFWMPPTSKAAKASYEGDFRKVLTLSRLAIKPEVPKNAASFLLGKSIKLIKKTEYECLITYADTFMKHTGAIYKATNWEYLGMTEATEIWTDKRGKIQGRKRGKKNLTKKEMIERGFHMKGKYPKHKFRIIF